MSPHQVHATWLIALLTAAGVVLRPFKLPEVVPAVVGALVLVLLGLLGPGDALAAVGKGTDVYLFLTGMMLLSELAREEGVFDYVAGQAAARAQGSSSRLLLLVYGVGVVVTMFMSNDATAVVLTPAVLAAAKKARMDPMPPLFACALIANAASFVLPISNPANLVVYGRDMPDLLTWIKQYALPSLASIVATYVVIRLWFRSELRQDAAGAETQLPELGAQGRVVLWGIAGTSAALMVASVLKWPLGAPALGACAVLAAVLAVRRRRLPTQALGAISWSVLPLVAGLFVVVEALEKAGAMTALSALFKQWAATPSDSGRWIAAGATALVCNLVNNLPAGLMAGGAVEAARIGPPLQGVIAMAVDLGPNLSVAGSLATVLWLVALRREGVAASGWQFLKLGAVAMPVALAAAVGVYLLQQAA